MMLHVATGSQVFVDVHGHRGRLPAVVTGLRGSTNPDESFIRIDVKFRDGRVAMGCHPDCVHLEA